MKTFSVTLNFNCNYGYIVYDLKNKTASVKIAAQDAKEKIEEYLKKPVTMDIAIGSTIRDFQTVTVNPLENVEAFKAAMTRLWNSTGVRVEWSMPPGIAEHLLDHYTGGGLSALKA